MNMLGYSPDDIELFRQYALDHSRVIKADIPPSLKQLETRYDVYNMPMSIVSAYGRMIARCKYHMERNKDNEHS
jgi:hypothetical protein